MGSIAVAVRSSDSGEVETLTSLGESFDGVGAGDDLTAGDADLSWSVVGGAESLVGDGAGGVVSPVSSGGSCAASVVELVTNVSAGGGTGSKVVSWTPEADAVYLVVGAYETWPMSGNPTVSGSVSAGGANVVDGPVFVDQSVDVSSDSWRQGHGTWLVTSSGSPSGDISFEVSAGGANVYNWLLAVVKVDASLDLSAALVQAMIDGGANGGSVNTYSLASSASAGNAVVSVHLWNDDSASTNAVAAPAGWVELLEAAGPTPRLQLAYSTTFDGTEITVPADSQTNGPWASTTIELEASCSSGSSGPVESALVADTDLLSSDVAVQVDVDAVADNGASDAVGVTAGHGPDGLDSGGYLLAVTTDHATIYRVDPDGSRTQIADHDNGQDWAFPVTARLELDGDTVRGLIDDTERMSVTDTTYNGAHAGIYSNTDTPSTFPNELDNWTAQALSAPASGPSESLHWLLGDHLGSASITVDAATGAVDRRRYLPYGGERGSVDSSVTDRSWIGQIHDESTGLQYLNARYYDPQLAQYLSVDPLVAQTGDAYSYGGGNPTSVADPMGLDPNGWACKNGNIKCDRSARGGLTTIKKVVFWARGRMSDRCLYVLRCSGNEQRAQVLAGRWLSTGNPYDSSISDSVSWEVYVIAGTRRWAPRADLVRHNDREIGVVEVKRWDPSQATRDRTNDQLDGYVDLLKDSGVPEASRADVQGFVAIYGKRRGAIEVGGTETMVTWGDTMQSGIVWYAELSRLDNYVDRHSDFQLEAVAERAHELERGIGRVDNASAAREWDRNHSMSGEPLIPLPIVPVPIYAVP